MAKKVTKDKKGKKVEEEEEDENEGGASLDDAFADDDDVSYAENKPKKEKKKNDDEEDEEEDEIPHIASPEITNDYTIKASKPVGKIKKGDKIKIDGIEYEVDSHYVLIDHKTTKEMAIELFDSKTDKDFQLRYFDDQVESTLEFYELQEIMYIKRAFSKVEW